MFASDHLRTDTVSDETVPHQPQRWFQFKNYCEENTVVLVIRLLRTHTHFPLSPYSYSLQPPIDLLFHSITLSYNLLFSKALPQPKYLSHLFCNTNQRTSELMLVLQRFRHHEGKADATMWPRQHLDNPPFIG